MPGHHSTALGAARILIAIVRVLNLLMGLAILLAVPASFVFEPFVLKLFSVRPPSIDPAWLLPALRIWIVLALPMVGLVHVLLARLSAIVETVGAGDPFVPENGVRLKRIAWCMLLIQLFHLLFGVMAGIVNAAGSRVDWELSLNGWLAVALLFVLAQVFEEGTRLREDLGKMI